MHISGGAGGFAAQQPYGDTKGMPPPQATPYVASGQPIMAPAGIQPGPYQQHPQQVVVVANAPNFGKIISSHL